MPEITLQHPWLWAGVLAAPAAWCIWTSFRPKAQPKEADFNTFLRPGAKSAPQLGTASLVGSHSSVRMHLQQQGKVAAGRQKQPQDFSTFLKNANSQEPRRQATSFSSFIRVPQKAEAVGSDGVTSSAAEAERSAAPERPQEDSKPVAVLYGTEYGFSKEIAEKAAAQLKETAKYWPRLIDMAEHPEGFAIESEQALLVVCSTQGDGVPPSEAREFCDWLSSGSAPKLARTHFSVCALGDTSYAHFCACGKMLDARLEQLGGRRFLGRADVNREDWKAVDAWIQAAVADLDGLELKAHGNTAGKEDAKPTAPKAKRLGKSRPYFGTIVASEGLCNIANKDDKDTIRVEIDLGDSRLSYLPGDALGILPFNCYKAVDELQQLLGAPADTAVPRPAWHYDDERAPQPESVPLREALAMCYDLRSPKHDLLNLLVESLKQQDGRAVNGSGNGSEHMGASQNVPSPEANTKHTEMNGNGHPALANGHLELSNGLTNGHENGHAGLANGDAGCGLSSKPCRSSLQDQIAKLQRLTQQGDAAVEKYLEPRHVIDLLSEYPAARPPLFKVLAALRPLLPRLYSISSSQLEHPHRVQVTVAVVRYASLSRERIGVTSTYLAERLQVGDRIPVYVHKNPDFRLPQDVSKPIIMVGPGTGLAPFRSFMQERLLSARAGSSGPLGQAVLYFGCRRSDQDYLYGALLEGWAKAGDLTLFSAFSRQQARKVYVQDRLRESGKLVWDLLEAGGHFYVCGDAAQMAGAVERELLQIIEDHQGQGREAAKTYLENLSAEQRYQRDVWF